MPGPTATAPEQLLHNKHQPAGLESALELLRLPSPRGDARVPSDNCAVVGASRNFCCAVGHGQRVHAAADGLQPAGRDGGQFEFLGLVFS